MSCRACRSCRSSWFSPISIIGMLSYIASLNDTDLAVWKVVQYISVIFNSGLWDGPSGPCYVENPYARPYDHRGTL